MLQKLIVNADDLGLTKAISDAIFEVFENGSLTSATLLVNMPGSEYAASEAKKYSKLGVGLHVNFTEGKCLTKNNRLTNAEGNFISRKDMFQKLISFKASSADVEKELIAQYDLCLKLGVKPTHIDSHEHTHMLPRAAKVFARFAKSKNLPVRITYPQIVVRDGGATNKMKAAKQLAMNLLVSNALMSYRGLKHNTSMNSVFDIHPPQPANENDYKLLLSKAKGNIHELMVHPYILSDELKEAYPDKTFFESKTNLFNIATAEYNCLRSFSIKKYLEENRKGVEMVNFWEL